MTENKGLSVSPCLLSDYIISDSVIFSDIMTIVVLFSVLISQYEHVLVVFYFWEVSSSFFVEGIMQVYKAKILLFYYSFLKCGL